MDRRFRLIFILLLLIPINIVAQNKESQIEYLSSHIDTLIKYQLPEGSNVGISVYDLTTGTPLYNYQGDKLSRPASTMKLLTTITALSRPDADEPFRTEVWYQGVIEQGALHGDLYVVGGYDPEFDDAALDSLVNMVNRFPFSSITGKIYGDISMKDSLMWGNGWAWDDTPYYYQPYLSPLMLNKGVLTVTATSGEKGDSARLECVPASSYYTVTNKTEGRTPGAGRFRVSRNWLENGNDVIVTGNVEGRRSGLVNIYSSQDFFMHTFVERLQAKGIYCSSEYGFKELQKDLNSVRMAYYETSMRVVVREIMKESDNLNAEALLCKLGAQATGKKRISAEEGLEEIRLLIKQMGDKPERYRLADGSGLSNYNYISPDLLVAFLKHAYSRTDVFQKLYKALPIAGIDGTLKNRMKKGTVSYKNVHAKTGSIAAISALAGYLRAANGHEVAFAIMNQNSLSSAKSRAFQDAVCEEIINTIRF